MDKLKMDNRNKWWDLITATFGGLWMAGFGGHSH